MCLIGETMPKPSNNMALGNMPSRLALFLSITKITGSWCREAALMLTLHMRASGFPAQKQSLLWILGISAGVKLTAC